MSAVATNWFKIKSKKKGLIVYCLKLNFDGKGEVILKQPIEIDGKRYMSNRSAKKELEKQMEQMLEGGDCATTA